LAAEADEDWSDAEGVPDWAVEADCDAGCHEACDAGRDVEAVKVIAVIASAAVARSSRNCLPRSVLFCNRFDIVPGNPLVALRPSYYDASRTA
jgi:hypothetical protein